MDFVFDKFIVETASLDGLLGSDFRCGTIDDVGAGAIFDVDDDGFRIPVDEEVADFTTDGRVAVVG